jgi:carbon storage regulator
MLVMTRRIGEKIMIGPNITLTILSMYGNQVPIGVDAPRDVGVHREEIYRLIELEQAAERKERI